MKQVLLPLYILALTTISALAQFTTLKGSRPKVQTAYDASVAHNYTHMSDSKHVQKFVRLDLLVRLPGNENYSLHQVGHPYLRPAGKLLVERLSHQYRKATGEKLIVTSATRTLDNAPPNSSSLSVHPAGIAVDFRVPHKESSRKWLENTLLTMQARGVIIATREFRPPHYHVVVIPQKYEEYVRSKQMQRR